MSGIMKSDQSLQLVRLYHKYYPDIMKQSYNKEGRRRKMDIWIAITQELNQEFGTTFTVVQYKKKIQNIQCIARQKLNRRNKGKPQKLVEAEQAFLKLIKDSVRSIHQRIQSDQTDEAESTDAPEDVKTETNDAPAEE